MFRCITDLKGLAIDVDSIQAELRDWLWFFERYQYVFITSEEGTAESLRKIYGNNYVYQMEHYLKLFSPNKIMHGNVLQRLELMTTEIAYVTGNKEFSDNAMAFLCGTIWITTDRITYEAASVAPDLICQSIEVLKSRLEKHVYGFYGEINFPANDNVKGYILPVILEADEDFLYLFMLGRYFSYSHYMSQIHPYSSAIYLNKRGKACGVLDEQFIKLYAAAVNRIKKSRGVDMICAVPVRPDNPNRFKRILQSIANQCDITDISDNFLCNEDYPAQKNLSELERQENVKGVFYYKGSLYGKNIVLIDDIVTTGATIKECVRVLKACGADNIFIIVLGVNQKQGSYWSSKTAQVNCPVCGERMLLFVNSNSGQFFYSCPLCGKTMGYEGGRNLLCSFVNSEFNVNGEDRDRI